MSRIHKIARLSTTGAITLAAAVSSVLAHAQEAAQVSQVAGDAASADPSAQRSTGSRLEEVIVQARRKDESSQEVPIAIQPVDPAVLESKGIVELSSFQKLVPAFSTAGGNRGGFAWLRGLQGIASYFADAPFVLRGAGQYFDIENVQVLKGPQGTLFGSSSAAGAFVVMPRRPTDYMESYVSVAGGNYDRQTFEAATNLPVSDKLSFRLAARHHDRDGYVKDISTGERYYDENELIIRPSMLWRPVAGVENYTVLHYYESDTNGRTWYYPTYNPYGALAAYTGQLPGQPGFLDTLAARHGRGGDLGPYRLDGMLQAEGVSGLEERLLQLVNSTTWDVTDNLTLTNIFAYREEGTRGVTDEQYFPNALNPAESFFEPSNDPRAIAERGRSIPRNPTWSEELKVSGSAFDGFLEYTVGGFYTRNRVRDKRVAWAETGGPLRASITEGDPRRPVESKAVYTQATFDLSNSVLEGLRATVGYRYTWDRNWQRVTQGLNPVRNDPTPFEDLPQRVIETEYKFSDYNILLGLNWQINADTMVYLTGSRGFTSGQVNASFPAPNNVTFPEILEQLEAGIKSTFDLGPMEVRANFSAFYGEYSDIQVSVVKLLQLEPAPAPPRTATVSENAAEGIVRGFDVELTVAPTDWLELSVFGSVISNKFLGWPVYNLNGEVVGDRKDTPFLGTPPHKWTGSATVQLPLNPSWGEASITVDYSRVAPRWYDANFPHGRNKPFAVHTLENGYGPASSTGERVPVNQEFTFEEVDLSFRWTQPMGMRGLTATAAVTNVFDKLGAYDGGYAWFAVGNKWQSPSPPRMYQIGLRYEF